jgi:hypothetical protein
MLDLVKQVQSVCQLCYNRNWSKWVHPTGCLCEHCHSQRLGLL